jgi:hypothetical protein
MKSRLEDVTVTKPVSDLPRYRIEFSIPIEIEESFSRDLGGKFAPSTPLIEADYDRWIRTYEQPQPLPEPCSTPDTRPRSHDADNNHWEPRTVLPRRWRLMWTSDGDAA